MSHTVYFDSSQLINIGSAPNANDGDTLRTAGSKINSIAEKLDSALESLENQFNTPFDSSQIGTDAISTTKIQDGAVTFDKIQSGAITNTSYGGSLNFDSLASDDLINLTSSDKIGIGTSATSPTYNLQIHGDADDTVRIRAATNSTLNLYDVASNTANGYDITSNGNTFSIKNSGNQSLGTDGKFVTYSEVAGGFNHYLKLMNNVWLTSSRVGVNIDQPTVALDVVGGIQSKNSAATSGVSITETGTIELTHLSSEAHIDFKNAIAEDYDVRLATTSGGDFYISTLGATKRLTILDTGEVGIGTNAPTQKLEISNGSVLSNYVAPNTSIIPFKGVTDDESEVSIQVSNSSGDFEIKKGLNFSAINISSAESLQIYQNNALNYQFQADGDFVTVGNITAFGSFSDRNLKENIETIPNALDKVSKINGVTFNYIGSKEPMTGVIAQEVQEVLPEAVYDTVDNTREDGRALAVRYGNMVGLLIEAIKELKAEIEELKNNV